MSGSFVLQAHAELERVLAIELAAIHEVVPRGWSPESQVSEKSVQRTADTLMAAALEPYSLILTARDPSGDIIGFHWLRIDKDAPEWAHIHSLWVAEARRNQDCYGPRFRSDMWDDVCSWSGHNNFQSSFGNHSLCP